MSKSSRKSRSGAMGKVTDLPTPCFLVDLDKVQQNTDRMLQTCRDLGVELRAHTKTHKTVEVAVLQTNGSKRCLAVSTLAEAEFYAENGFDDILLAFPITEDKIRRCVALMAKLKKFHVLVSGDEGLQCLENHSSNLPDGKVWSVVLEIDAGYGRTGYVCEDIETISQAAKKVESSNVMRLEKLYYHCGNSYSVQTKKEREELQSTHIEKIMGVQNTLREHFNINCTSGVGSTPTCSLPVKANAVFTEFHPGNYVFYDYEQYLLNSCAESDIACRVMTRVVAHKPEKHMILIDCGFTALSHDGMYQRLPLDFCVIQGESNLRLKGMSQEIGKVVAKEGELDCRVYPVGTILYIIPYHSCATAALHTVYHVHSGNDMVAQWKPVRGW